MDRTRGDVMVVVIVEIAERVAGIEVATQSK